MLRYLRNLMRDSRDAWFGDEADHRHGRVYYLLLFLWYDARSVFRKRRNP